MKSRRAGHGCSSGIAPAPSRGPRSFPTQAACAPPPPQRSTLGDVPALAAAIDRARRDVETWRQTEEAWRAVWGGDS